MKEKEKAAGPDVAEDGELGGRGSEGYPVTGKEQ